MKQKILEFMMNQGILIDPSAAEHILSQKDPISYAENIIRNMKEFPVILTVECLREMENSEAIGSITFDTGSQKELQNSVSDVKVEPIVSQEKNDSLNDPINDPLKKELDVENPISPEQATTFTQVATTVTLTPQITTSGVKTRKSLAAEYSSNIKVIKDITGNSTTNGSVKGFMEYFRDRFNRLGEILRNKRELSGASDIRTAKRMAGQVKTIGIVNDSRITKNGNKMLIIEDEHESLRIIISKENKFFNESTVIDEVIGVTGNIGKSEMLIAESIVRPDIPGMRIPNKADIDLSVAFISDLHVGSKTFLSDQWDRFLKWLRSCEDGSEKVKYVVIAGDIVDGVGVFPGQEAELAIPDIHDQYQDFAQKITDIPDYIKLIILPGNHDAVRPSEPQPTFSEEIRKIMNRADIQFCGNPSMISIEGVNILAYHGRSFDDLIPQFPGTSYSSPIPIMKEMLKRRHLAPIYGGKTPIAPESSDYLLIETVPDIFVTGHVHSIGMEVYRGVILINSSTWQAQTSYQVMHNFNPIPAKVPLVNLQNGEWEIKNFML